MQTKKQVLILLLASSLLAANSFSIIGQDSQAEGQTKVAKTILSAATSSSKSSASSSSKSSASSSSKSNTTNTTNTTNTNMSVPLPYWQLSYVNGSFAGQVQIGQSDNLWLEVDIDSPTFIVTTLMPKNISAGATQGYNPTTSPTMSMLDNFRYRDGTNNQIGYYGSDRGCFYLDSQQELYKGMSKICQNNSAPFNIFGAVYYTEKYSPFQGVIGLGPGDSPNYNTNFLSQFKTAVNNSVIQDIWSLYAGPFSNNQTQLFIGGIKQSLIAVGDNSSVYGINYYNITGTNWTIAMTDVRQSNYSYFLANETSKAYFNYQVDGIYFPYATYTKIVANLTKTIPGLLCSTTSYTSCIYNDVCGNLVSKLNPFKFSFGDGLVYSLPVQDSAVDTSNATTCTVNIGRQATKIGYVTLGYPFMKAFYTVYNHANSTIGIAVSTNSFGSVSSSF